MLNKLLPLLFLLSFACQAQKGWVFNTDIKRGNQNQYIYIVGETKNDLLASNEVVVYHDTAFVKLDDLSKPKKKPFVPTPASAAKVGLIMMDSVINGKKVKVIKEDLSDDKESGYESTSVGSMSNSGSNNVAIGQQALNNITMGYGSLQRIPDDNPKPGEKLYPCKYCDMQRTRAHIKYIARMHGEGYVQISKGVWIKTDE